MKPDIMQLGPQSRAWAVRLAFAVALVGRWRQRGAASFVICEKGRVHPLRGPEVPAGAVSRRLDSRGRTTPGATTDSTRRLPGEMRRDGSV